MLKQDTKVEIVDERDEKGTTLQEILKLLSQKQSVFDYARKNPSKAGLLIILVGILTLVFSGRMIRLIMSVSNIILRVVAVYYVIKNAFSFLPKFGRKKRA
ncbi:MAG: hypothetical protein GX568_04290 [Candidatus Gastranaerophilales bacterium]|nr:hypothetical protein [Candidatus Gastranaerophilales bacterium]